jgi:hypothetical protein
MSGFVPPAEGGVLMRGTAIPSAASPGRLSGRILSTWQQAREAELWRRGKRIIGWPVPLRIVSLR